MRRKAWGMLVLSMCIPTLAFAQNSKTMTVQEIKTYASKNSPTIINAIDSLTQAQQNLKGLLTLDSSTLSVSGGYTYVKVKDTTTLESTGPTATASVSVPIIPQVSVSGSVTTDFSSTPEASFGVTLSPFATGSPNYQNVSAYRKAQVQLNSLNITVPIDAESAALTVIQGQQTAKSANAALTLEQDKYNILQKQYNIGEATFSDLYTEMTNLSNARKTNFDAQRNLLSLRMNLYKILGPAIGAINVNPITNDNMLALVTARDNELTAREKSEPSSVTLLDDLIDLAALNSQLKLTPAYTPSVTVSARTGIPLNSASASLSVSVSPSQFQSDTRDNIKTEIASKQRDIDLERQNIELQKSMYEKAVDVAREVLAAAQTNLKKANDTLQENTVLYKQGQLTDIDLESSRLAVTSAEDQLFSAALGLYNALGSLLQLYEVQ